MTTTQLTSLPIIDFSLAEGNEQEQAELRDQLRRVTHEVGFFYLTGHGIDRDFIKEFVSTSREFFTLPEESKLSLENTQSPHFRGYTRVGGELTQGKVDWREQLDIGPERPALDRTIFTEDFWALQGPNLWPEELPRLRELSERWIAELSELSRKLLSEWAAALGAPSDFFDASFDELSAPLLKIVRYPGKSGEIPQQGVGAHKDLGVLTLLYVEEGKAGLQVEYEGEWIDAPPVSGAFVVNIGEMLEVATNGYLKATLHRVISPEIGNDRISFPFFYAPRLNASIPTIELPEELAENSRGITQDPNNVLHTIFGENSLKSRVRAHPNVVEAHHPHLMSN
ncbi:isopenicillin N synthase-like dioxygenase [Aurantimicrobium minutum]|uniref:isopenicillin N synthase family dioxygenase n=1 Tax=Aurantimicrobium minutum TaxID=708131 RepID=UPI00247347EA|nr:2-oxoglutarate and iron-dependent oxygenase domain-containing protein [Aurantimicrobium minutum]MDH6409403.1 isopenicillin N synthase-like dioxygenase [Aurantimicrobium minutum]